MTMTVPMTIILMDEMTGVVTKGNSKVIGKRIEKVEIKQSESSLFLVVTTTTLVFQSFSRRPIEVGQLWTKLLGL
jgi:hypothetical protein